jgi:hypothetical protein
MKSLLLNCTLVLGFVVHENPSDATPKPSLCNFDSNVKNPRTLACSWDTKRRL